MSLEDLIDRLAEQNLEDDEREKEEQEVKEEKDDDDLDVDEEDVAEVDRLIQVRQTEGEGEKS